MAKRAVVFDLDGTLWDATEWYGELISGGEAARKAVAVARLSEGQPVAKLLRSAGYTEARFAGVCRERGRLLVCYGGLLSLLSRLTRAGLRLGVATNLPSWIAQPMLDATGLAEFFGAVIGYGATRSHKPHPAPLLGP